MKTLILGLIVTLIAGTVTYAAEQSGVKSPQPAKTTGVKDATTGMEFVFVKGGCFQMGDIFNGTSNHAKTVHTACVSDFYLGKYEVTQGQWQKLMGNNPSGFNKCGSNCPVENVSWDDTQEFISRLNGKSDKTKYRLPTEAEWEYAARSGGKNEEYPGGLPLTEVAWYEGNSNNSTHPVGTKKPNGLGLYDMIGNIAEWCSDWFNEDDYADSQQQNPQGPDSGTRRVMRGERWSTTRENPKALRTTSRHFDHPEQRENNYGFRLVLQHVK